MDWDMALQIFTLRFKAIQDKYGNDAIAWLGTGQICTEELAFLGALAKFGMGMLHGDGNTRQCMATAATAYKQSFGFDAPPYTYKDFEESDVLVFVGSNLCIAHPIMWQRVCQNRNHPEIIVVDPRKTETAMAATQHYAIKPKSDLVLQYWGCGEMFKEWSSPEAAFQILKKLSRGQPCDITGIRDYQMIDEAGGIQWPLPDGCAPAFITNTVQVGHLFIPMHYATANELTFPAFDPYSRQPSYKACAVSVVPLREKSG